MTDAVQAAATEGGVIDCCGAVTGGYTPDTIRVTARKPVRLFFRREETAACSEQVALPAFGRSAPLPTGTVVPVEFMPGDPDEHEFKCQMGMLRGKIVVEAASHGCY
ncbi:MAG: cupredoxin domain-containing protein [Chloroflexota bacterium]